MSATKFFAALPRRVALWTGIFGLAAIYLFATRPPPLADDETAGRKAPIATAFRILAAENDAARALWTADIVAAGTKAGLRFHEKWRDADMEAGPLPGPFLTAAGAAAPKTRVAPGPVLAPALPRA